MPLEDPPVEQPKDSKENTTERETALLRVFDFPSPELEDES